MDRLKTKIADGPVLSADRGVSEGGDPGRRVVLDSRGGAPQGAVLSPLLSNIYLDPLDHLMAREGFEMVRYADDFVILCRTAEEAERALESGATVGGRQRPDAASDEDDGSSTRGRTSFDFLGYQLSGTETLAAEEEPEEAQGHDSGQNDAGHVGR